LPLLSPAGPGISICGPMMLKYLSPEQAEKLCPVLTFLSPRT
jgi:hypothetical protein